MTVRRTAGKTHMRGGGRAKRKGPAGGRSRRGGEQGADKTVHSGGPLSVSPQRNETLGKGASHVLQRGLTCRELS